MMRVHLICLLVVSLFTACSKREEPKPVTPVIPPPALSITNPATAAPVAEGKIERGFDVKNAGHLFLTFPGTWKDSITRVQEKDRIFDAIKFVPASGDDFALMVDLINVGEDNTKNLDVRVALQKAGAGELERSVEKSLDIQDLIGNQATGCYFVVTDKNLTITRHKPGDYPYLTQGYAKIGALVLSFRLVSIHLAAEQQALFEMIKGARLEKKQLEPGKP